MPYRLYLVNTLTGKKTGKKRDYPSLEHLRLYSKETYERYNREHYFTDTPTNTKAELCFLNGYNKWELVSEEDMKNILKIWEK